MVNQSWESLHISCSLVQSAPILSEVLAEDAYKYLAVVTRKGGNASKVLTYSAPEFLLSGLEPGTQYSVQLYNLLIQGRSRQHQTHVSQAERGNDERGLPACHSFPLPRF